jgi:hypothetical protein
VETEGLVDTLEDVYRHAEGIRFLKRRDEYELFKECDPKYFPRKIWDKAVRESDPYLVDMDLFTFIKFTQNGVKSKITFLSIFPTAYFSCAFTCDIGLFKTCYLSGKSLMDAHFYFIVRKQVSDSLVDLFDNR